MSKSCVLHPRLSNGEKSPLFTRLKNFLGDRREAEGVYYRAITPAFKQAFPNVRFDENGEPLFEDLIHYCGIAHNKSMTELIDSLNRDYGTEPVPKNLQSSIELQRIASTYNMTNPLQDMSHAVITTSESQSRVEIARGQQPHLGERQKYNAELNARLTDLLHSWGADVAALEKLEESMNADGVMDLNAATNAATGLKEVIRIAKGERGQAALPEEWGHFVVDAVVDSPLRDRILNTLKNEEVLQRLLGSQYDDYNELYNGNLDLMAKEALGKMMAQVLNNFDVNAPNDRLFERYKNNVLGFFGSKDADAIDTIINEVREQVYEFTTNAFNNKYKLDISGKDYKGKLFHLGERVSRDHKMLERVIQQERKRLSLYGEGARATAREREERRRGFDERQKLFIEKLTYDLNNHNEMEGLYSYLSTAIATLKNLSERLEQAYNSQTSWKDKFSTLRNIRDYMSSYGSIMEELRQEMHQAKREGDTRFQDKLQSALDEFSGLLARLGTDWAEISKDEFARFLEPFEGESISMYIRGERKQYTIRELLDYCERDISIVERWTDAMADSTDPILRIYDSIVKDAKNKARFATIEDEKQLLMYSKKLEDAGITNTEFMYEKRTKDGRPSGNFVTKYNWSDYYTDLADYIKSIKEEDKSVKATLISEWKIQHSDGHGNPSDKYLSKQYQAIQNNKAMKDYYDFVMQLKRRLDYRLPARFVRFNKAPQIRRDFLERVMGKGNKFQYMWESFKDELVRREDDTEFAYARQDFEGNQIHNLPIYYTRSLKDKFDLSMDCTSAMIAYASMAEDYAAMNNVIDALETGRTLLAERRVARTRGGKIMTEVLNKVPNVLSQRGEVANFMARLNDFMLMQVYGEQMKDEGVILGMDVGKAANFINKIQSYGTTALSVLTGSANLLQNITMGNIESIFGEFFTTKELAQADWEYTKMIGSYLGEIGNRIQTSKMALFAEKFNVLQNYKQHVRGIDWDRKTWASRAMKEDSLWFTTSAGDHYTQMRTAIALTKRLKLTDSDGKTPISLFDALEVEYLDKDHPEYGARLVIKKGVTDENGNPVGNDYFGQVSKKIRGINNKLYGIYNQEDKSAMQSRAVGRLLIMYRNWMRPMWLKRYGVERYNYDTNTFEEGYYRTMYHFLKQSYADMKKGQLDLVKQWNTLSDSQKSNIWHGLVELTTFWTLFAIVASLKGLPDDDKEDWLTEFVNYSIVRLKADMGSLVPSTEMLGEAQRLFENPFAAIQIFNKTRQLLNLFDPDTWTTEIDQGIWKGHTQAEKILLQPLPFIRQFMNVFDPDEPAKWYK